MKPPKFNRGNLVKTIYGQVAYYYHDNKLHIKDVFPKDSGKKGVIFESILTADNETFNYTVIYIETGNRSCWMPESNLEFIENGGEHLFQIARDNEKRLVEKDTDLKHIICNWDDMTFNARNIIFLANLIGFQLSHFKRNDYGQLGKDWDMLKPIYDHLINSSSIEEAKIIISSDALKILKISDVYNSIKNIKLTENKHEV